MKVFLLRTNQTSAITAREEMQLKDLIQLSYEVIFKQRQLNISSHVYRKRLFSLQTNAPHFIKPPPHVHSEKDLQHLFDPLLKAIEDVHEKRAMNDEYALTPRVTATSAATPALNDEDEFRAKIMQVGSRIKVQWNADEVKDSGWKPGWYMATVQQYNTEQDSIVIVYTSEPDNVYEEDLTPLISAGRIRHVWSPL